MVRTCGQGYHHGRNLARVAERETHHGTEFSRVSRGHLLIPLIGFPGSLSALAQIKRGI